MEDNKAKMTDTKQLIDDLGLKDAEAIEQFFTFSPFLFQRDNTLEMLAIAFIVLKVAKQPDGLKTLKELGLQYIKTCGEVLKALEGASGGNWLICWINQKLSLRVLKRLGLVTVGDYASLEASYNSMFTVISAKEAIVDTITAVGSFTNVLGGLGK